MSSLSIVYYLAILLTKISICLLYLRIFGVHPTFRKLVIGGITLATVYHSATCGLAIAQIVKCAGLSDLHDSLCEKTPKLTVFTASMNMATDLYIFVLPIGPIMQLKVQKGRKYGILIIFLSGSV